MIETNEPAQETQSRGETHFDRVSWAVLIFVMLVLMLSLAQTYYRLTLPWDGWSFTRDATGSGERLIFDQYLVAGSSPVRPGDRLLAVQGQSTDEILTRALTFNPERPTNWKVGGTANYTVLRDGQVQYHTVSLVNLTPGQIANRILLNWLVNPSLLPALFIGFFVFFRRPRIPAARLLLILTACYFASDGIAKSVSGSNVIGLAELFYREAYWPSQLFINFIWPLVIGPVYAHFFLAFPLVKRPLLLWPRFTLVALYGAAPLALLLATAVGLLVPLAFWRIWATFSLLDLLLIVSIAIVSATHSLLTMHEPTMRAQIRWIAVGTVITSVGALSGFMLGSLGLVGQNWLVDLFAFRALFLAFPIAVAIAILRYQLFDIDVIIRRTLIYGLLSFILVFVYIAIIVLLQEVFRDVTGQQQSGLVTAISTLAIAALFIPLREWIQRGIDRHFYRRKYDATRTLAAFSAKMRDEVELDRLTEDLLRVIDETMQPSCVSLWLKQPAEGKNEEQVPGSSSEP